MPDGLRFVLTVKLNDKNMQDQVDVAQALRRVADRLCSYANTYWGPYALEGKVYDNEKQEVGTWELKGPYDDNDD